MVIINFLDGTNLEIYSDTVLNGFKNISAGDKQEFYIANVFTDSIDGQLSIDGSRLATVNPKLGIIGFLLSVDCFSIGTDLQNDIVYFTSAIMSVENSYGRIGIEPNVISINMKK